MRKLFYFLFLLCLSLISMAILFNFFSRKEPLFLVKGVKITGSRQLCEKEIMDMVAPHIGGKSIFEVNTEKVRKSIITHPYVKDVRIKRVYPFYLHVEIKERKPSALWVRPDGTLKVIDEDGYPYREMLKDEGVDFFLIHAKSQNEVREVFSLVSKWLKDGLISEDFLSQVLCLNGAFTIITKENVEIILGNEELERRLKKAKRVLEDGKKRGLLIKRIDARFEKGAIVGERREG